MLIGNLNEIVNTVDEVFEGQSEAARCRFLCRVWRVVRAVVVGTVVGTIVGLAVLRPDAGATIGFVYSIVDALGGNCFGAFQCKSWYQDCKSGECYNK